VRSLAGHTHRQNIHQKIPLLAPCPASSSSSSSHQRRSSASLLPHRHPFGAAVDRTHLSLYRSTRPPSPQHLRFRLRHLHRSRYATPREERRRAPAPHVATSSSKATCVRTVSQTCVLFPFRLSYPSVIRRAQGVRSARVTSAATSSSRETRARSASQLRVRSLNPLRPRCVSRGPTETIT
jgi:hypothetical protein